MKVVLEGGIYDLDLAGRILVTDRSDLVDLSVMSRDFRLRFILRDSIAEPAQAHVRLSANLANLAAEILEQKGSDPGCNLSIRFRTRIVNPDQECHVLGEGIRQIWGKGITMTQQISYLFGDESPQYLNNIQISFDHVITETHIDDIPSLLNHIVKTLRFLDHTALS
ncbi:hypothetical protein [Paenibacillus swuensis]|uniref:hypothetical protein n=1 Tax=Paenibacillus swuensis TaxID=1178515 RepID=UPI0012FB472C|nr:hypothetical protein [Paenibacillus swuensis]